MESIGTVTLFFHVIAGFSALLFGLIAIIAKKGRKVHTKTGLIFFYSMLFVAASGFLVSIIRSNQFLLYISLFTLFMNYAGYRSIQNKQIKPNKLDWIIWGVGAINSFFMIYSMNIILMVFGGLSVFLVIQDFRLFILTNKRKLIPKKTWLRRHIGMMMGTYIATSTAFLLVNVRDFEPAWIPWLTPTFVGAPLIFYFSRKFVSKK